jgi:hypothetical protein
MKEALPLEKKEKMLAGVEQKLTCLTRKIPCCHRNFLPPLVSVESVRLPDLSKSIGLKIKDFIIYTVASLFELLPGDGQIKRKSKSATNRQRIYHCSRVGSPAFATAPDICVAAFFYTE